MGCPLEVLTDGETLLSVDGNLCNKGLEYAKLESMDPRRTVTGSVLIRNGALPLVSAKTRSSVPKGKIFGVMNALRYAEVFAPVDIGDILIADVAETGIDIIATKRIDSRTPELT